MKIIEQLSMWGVYFNHLFMHPLLISIMIFSFIASISFFILFRKTDKIKAKTNYLYAHIFFLFLPFIFSVLLWECIMPIFMCTPKLIIYGLSGGSAIGLLTSFLVIPYVYPWATNSRVIKNKGMINFLKRQTKNLKIKKTNLYSVEDIAPIAYSITNTKPAIFLSVGLCELLNKKEREAVLLHELYHIKNNSSFWKFSMSNMKMFSPLSSFSSIRKSLEKEEKDADLFAVKIQGTKIFLHSAKYKVNKWNKF
ncbi:M48 family metalloprotease [Candidatus Woesearchaeota archaeon]|nr:M48 family metalloprotease [Candidatus Woesearchaeota archaeon]